MNPLPFAPFESHLDHGRALAILRDAVAGTPDTHVGGTEAVALDASDAHRRDLQVILPVILLLVLLALGALLRSAVAPVVLVATVVALLIIALNLFLLGQTFLG